MWRRVAECALVMVLLVAAFAPLLLMDAGLTTRPGSHLLTWYLLGKLTAIGTAGIGGAIGGVLGVGAAMGRQLGMARRDCALRGAAVGAYLGLVVNVTCFLYGCHPLLPSLVGGLGMGFCAGLTGFFINVAQRSFVNALECRARNDTAGALRHIRKYLDSAGRDPGARHRVLRAEQLLRELEGKPADGWGTEPEAALAPAGRGTEPEALPAPAGRGTEPEAPRRGPS